MTKTKPKLSIHKYADVSTCHITKKDAEILERFADDVPLLFTHNPPFTVAKYAEGFFIPLGSGNWANEAEHDSLSEGLSEEFANLLHHVVEQGAFVLRLDADGDKVDGLPTFDW